MEYYLLHGLVLLAVFIMVGSAYTVCKVIYCSIYGKAVFNIRSNKFRGSFGKRLHMRVKPFSDGKKHVYLPLRYVAYSLGGRITRHEGGKLLIKILDKRVRVNQDNSITIENKFIDNLNRKINEGIKVVDGEIMVKDRHIKSIFDVNLEVNNTTGDVVIK